MPFPYPEAERGRKISQGTYRQLKSSGDMPNATANISDLSHLGEGRGIAMGAAGFHSGLISLHMVGQKVNS